MKICVLLIADSALAGINYFIKQLILNYTPSFIPLIAEGLWSMDHGPWTKTSAPTQFLMIVNTPFLSHLTTEEGL